MTIQVFTVVLDRRPTDDELDVLYEAGCDDAAFAVERGLPIATFDRESLTLADAVVSAILMLESTGLVPLRVVDEDLLTLADIADRIGQSRESVRRYVTGERGTGGFPPPINPGRDGVMFYRWSEVALWVRQNLHLDVPDVDSTLVVANLMLQARQHRHKVAHMSALSNLLAA